MTVRWAAPVIGEPRQNGRGTMATPGIPAMTVPPFVAAKQQWPHLSVFKLGRPSWLLGYEWAWDIVDPTGIRIDGAVARSWQEALAVGLAALELASARWPT